MRSVAAALVMIGVGFNAAVVSAADFASSQWIWTGSPASREPVDTPIFVRRVFELDSAPVRATLAVTADNSHETFVNGTQVGRGDTWNAPHLSDVTQLLVKGRNVIAIKASNSGGAAGLIAKLQARLPTGPRVVIATSADWKAALTASEGWNSAAFDDSAWAAVAVLGPVGIAPWGQFDTSSSVGVDATITEYRSATEEITRFELPEGFQIELVAAEPLIINPVCIALDDRNHLYVAESHTYRFGPAGSPVKPAGNPIVRLDPLPDGKGFCRTVIADGFEDPVMGMAIRDGRLWAAANNVLFRFDLAADGPATNKTKILVDKNKAWNPFGMFVLEWSLDGDLLMSVGNHEIDIGPAGQPKGQGISGRGGSGIVVRMKPDGSQLERLVHGLRVPYAFEIDPFGQHWQLSNGEGNPNRFVRVIEGVDYHCYSRPNVLGNWLTGGHPLAPPCFELPRGATTQLLRYYGANFPASYQGSLFLDNWGAHGFGGPNRTIFRYVPDERNAIGEKEAFLVCGDPHFRCSHVLTAPDGSLYIADWYGRDDESDLTGRIWRVSYTGDDKPPVAHTLSAAAWTDDGYAVAALGSPDHTIRAKAIATLAARGNAALPAVAAAAQTGDAVAAAHALWTLMRMASPEATAALGAGAKHPDWRVRRLALDLLDRRKAETLAETAKALVSDADPAVRVRAASMLKDAGEKRTALVAALLAGAAADEHLRYEAAWHLADVADAATLEAVLTNSDEKVNLSGLIAIDVAGYERRASHDVAMNALGKALVEPGRLDRTLLFDLAALHDAAAVVDALRNIVAKVDEEPGITARAILLLRSKSAGEALDPRSVDRFLAAIKSGKVHAHSIADQMTVLELLESEGPTPFTISRIDAGTQSGDKLLREKAHRMARSFGHAASALAPSLWKRLTDPNATDLDRKLEVLTTLLAVENEPDVTQWSQLLRTAQGPLLVDIVRSWRQLGATTPLATVLLDRAPEMIAAKPEAKGDFAAVVAAWPSAAGAVQRLSLDPLPDSADPYTAAASAAARTPESELLGRRVFERTGCVKCHSVFGGNTERAPALAGLGKAQKPAYLIESILDPSAVIKTGYETETILMHDGTVHVGLVKEVGDTLRVLLPDSEVKVAKSDIDERSVQKKSLMPDGQHKTMSPAEFADLIHYLKSL